MKADELEMLQSGTEAAIEAAFKPFAEIIEKLFVPAADEAGETFKNLVAITIGDRLRFYRAFQQLKFWKKFKEITEAAGIVAGPVPPGLLVKIVEEASLEDNDDLQERWAALLANAANPDSDAEIPPSFPTMLRQLSSIDAKLLDAMFDSATTWVNPKPAPLSLVIRGQRVSLGSATDIFRSHYLPARGITPRGQPSEYADFYAEFELSLGNLRQLLLVEVEDNTTRVVADFKANAGASIDQGGFNGLVRTLIESLGQKSYSLTTLGCAFVTACRRPLRQASSG